MVPKNVLDSCREYLHSNHIFSVNENWLTEAIEYFINMFGDEDVQMIHLAVKKQWYGHDLTKISTGCLPRNLKGHKKTILKGHYTLQINSITSFAIFSEHKQYFMRHSNLKKKMERAVEMLDMHNLVDKMLQLYMTDGVQEVNGIVFKPINNLYVNTVPGVKVFIKGPLVSYGEFLLLSNKNCQLLDGDVEQLMSEQFEQTKLLMELIRNHGVEKGMPSSVNENVKCSNNEALNIINQPLWIKETNVNSNYIHSNIYITNTVNNTSPNLIEVPISTRSKTPENQIKLRPIERSKIENYITDPLPGISANSHIIPNTVADRPRRKSKDNLTNVIPLENNVHTNGILMSEQLEQTQSIMELIRIYGLQEGIPSSLSHYENCGNNEPVYVDKAVNSNYINLTIDKTNIVNSTNPNLNEIPISITSKVQNKLKLRKRSKEKYVTDPIPGTSASSHIISNNEGESPMKKSKGSLINVTPLKNKKYTNGLSTLPTQIDLPNEIQSCNKDRSTSICPNTQIDTINLLSSESPSNSTVNSPQHLNNNSDYQNYLEVESDKRKRSRNNSESSITLESLTDSLRLYLTQTEDCFPTDTNLEQDDNNSSNGSIFDEEIF